MVASTSLLASVVTSPLSSRVISLPRTRASCKPPLTLRLMESSLRTPSPACMATSAARAKLSFLEFFLAVRPPLVPARLVLVHPPRVASMLLSLQVSQATLPVPWELTSLPRVRRLLTQLSRALLTADCLDLL